MLTLRCSLTIALTQQGANIRLPRKSLACTCYVYQQDSERPDTQGVPTSSTIERK